MELQHFLFLENLFVYLFYFTILYWFCHTLTWIRHGCTCVPHPEPPSLLPPHHIPLGHPSVPALSTLSHASSLDWRFISHMTVCMFQCHSSISSHPRAFSAFIPASAQAPSIRTLLPSSRLMHCSLEFHHQLSQHSGSHSNCYIAR